MSIKAIETSYKGYKFRSRLEARWAVFFDTIGFRWTYEQQGFVVNEDLCYLPDFYLPDWNLYIEVKPDLPAAKVNEGALNCYDSKDGYTDIGKFVVASENMESKTSIGTKQGIVMLCGVPGVPQLREYKGRWRLDDGACALILHNTLDGSCITINAWSCSSDGEVDLWPFYRGGVVVEGWLKSPLFPSGTMDRLYRGSGRSFHSKKLLDAYVAARSARFEHGESGVSQ